jgi:hypothetical protein
LTVIDALKIPNTVYLLLVNYVVEAAIEPEFMGLYPIQLLAFFGGEMKLKQLIFRNGKFERFFNFFYEGKKIILTNAYRKKGRKVDNKELARAIGSKKDYERRIKEGGYYA